MTLDPRRRPTHNVMISHAIFHTRARAHTQVTCHHELVSLSKVTCSSRISGRSTFTVNYRHRESSLTRRFSRYPSSCVSRGDRSADKSESIAYRPSRRLPLSRRSTTPGRIDDRALRTEDPRDVVGGHVVVVSHRWRLPLLAESRSR